MKFNNEHAAPECKVLLLPSGVALQNVHAVDTRTGTLQRWTKTPGEEQSELQLHHVKFVYIHTTAGLVDCIGIESVGLTIWQ